MLLFRALLSLALGGLVLWRNLPSALLFLAPRLQRSKPAPDDLVAAEEELLALVDEELKPLGFDRLGARLEVRPLARAVASFDYVHRDEPVFASVFRQRDEVNLYYLTAFEGGGFVLTADHKRPSTDTDEVLAGGLADIKPDALLAAHRRRVESMKAKGKAPIKERTLEARARLADAWFQGPGAKESRIRQANALILSLLAVFIIVSVVYGGARSAGESTRPASTSPEATPARQEEVK